MTETETDELIVLAGMITIGVIINLPEQVTGIITEETIGTILVYLISQMSKIYRHRDGRYQGRSNYRNDRNNDYRRDDRDNRRR